MSDRWETATQALGIIDEIGRSMDKPLSVAREILVAALNSPEIRQAIRAKASDIIAHERTMTPDEEIEARR